MIRFARVGRKGVHVLEAVAHDPVGTEQVLTQLDRLLPHHIHTDAAPWAWDALARGSRRVDAVEDAVAAAMAQAEPQALYRALAQWARSAGATVSLLAGTMERPPRKAVRQAVRLLRREGLEAPTVQGAVEEFRGQVLARLPPLRDWYATRAGLVTTRLQQVAAAGHETVAVLAYPDGPFVADLVGRGNRAERF